MGGYKHLGRSFRIVKGEVFLSWGDFGSRAEARAELAELRWQGVRSFAVHNKPEDYSRLFIEQQSAA